MATSDQDDSHIKEQVTWIGQLYRDEHAAAELMFEKVRAYPKSATRVIPVALHIRILSGFKSLCITWLLCR